MLTEQNVFNDLMKSANLVSNVERRFLVDYYYQMQRYRITAANQMRSMKEEPHAVMDFLFKEMMRAEKQTKRFLAKSIKDDPVGEWLLGLVGIGPVIASGFIATLDVDAAPHPSSFVRFAGLDPTLEWKAGQKRPYNGFLKTLCWKAGESFVKNSGRENCFYGHLYAERKDYETRKNQRGENAEAAATQLERFNYGKNTDAYKNYIKGLLPPAHVHARATRWVMTIFLSHLWTVMYEAKHNKKAEMPWVIAHGKHDTFIDVPNWEHPK